MYKMITCKRLHEAVEQSMRLLRNAPIIAGENQDQMDQLKELSLVINIEDISEITISKAMPGDLYSLVEYELEFLDGVRDWENEWEYTYHRLFNQYYNECIEELKRNKYTRRAVLPIAGEKSYGNTHPPCMQLIMFKVVDNKLNMTVVFRSNDGAKAFAMNSFALALLANKVAKEIGVEVGSYTHIANSFHVYSRDWDTLDSYINMFNSRDPGDLYYTMDDYNEAKEEHEAEFRAACEKRRQEKGL